MTTDELRAESQMVQNESGGELTTRAAMLLGAADQIDDLEREIERLRLADREAEIFCKKMLIRCADSVRAENALPKTADGVTVVPGMKLYPLHSLPPEDLDGGEDYAIVEMHATDPFGGDDIEPDQLSLNYSSKEAAATALAKQVSS